MSSMRTRAHLHELCERYRRTSIYQKRGTRKLGQEHAAIAEAVLDRDAERACRLIEQHFAITAQAFSEDAGG